MAFKVHQTPSEKSDFDYDALNKYVVETAQLETEETITGIITGIVDIGIQEQENAKVVSNLTPEQEEEEIAKNPNTYFFDEDGKRYKGYPQRPTQQVVYCVDFPDIILDKGQFFGESKPLPLRLYIGGKNWDGESRLMKVGHGLNLKTSRDSKWRSFDRKHRFYDLASAAKLLDSDEHFSPDRIDELLGRAFQFKVRIYFKEGKNGKKYYTESLSFASGLGRGMKAPVLPAEVKPFVIQFDDENNDLEALEWLPPHVKNSIRAALNYAREDGNGTVFPSVIKKQLDSIEAKSKGNHDENESDSEHDVVLSPTKPKAKKAPVPAVEEDDDDVDPFLDADDEDSIEAEGV